MLIKLGVNLFKGTFKAQHKIKGNSIEQLKLLTIYVIKGEEQLNIH